MKARSLAVAALAALALSSCTTTAPTTASPSPAASSPSATGSATPTAPATPEPAPTEQPTPDPPTPEPTTPAIDPDAVAAQFADVVPTAWGLEVPGVVTNQPASGIALTLDGCGGPSGSRVDHDLIDGLIARNVPATLFLNARWIDANPDLAAQLAANPLFELANHGTSHKPLSVTGEKAYGITGTASSADAVAEVWTNHERLTALTGTPPRWFRSGTAHYDDVATQIVGALGERVAGFTINGDGGATLSAAQVEREVLRAGPGDIVIAHLNQPDGDTAEGLLAAVDQLLAGGATFVLLD